MTTPSKVISLAADGATATVADASITDILTTALSGTKVLTGVYGYAQKVGLVVAGNVVMNKIHTGDFVKFKSPQDNFAGSLNYGR